MDISVGLLSNWPRTNDPTYQPDYGDTREVVKTFIRMPAAERRIEVTKFSALYCFPQFDLYQAGGFYLLLRLAFLLPESMPRDRARVFGGWRHPSIGVPEEPFDLQWPVRPAGEGRLRIERFIGYFGKGYDAIGEYEYFTARFELRDPATIGVIE
jgi:hypothetical protein